MNQTKLFAASVAALIVACGPGGNITGVSFLAVEVASKRLELLLEVVPTAAGDRLADKSG